MAERRDVVAALARGKQHQSIEPPFDTSAAV
jgi:hypothetical protein